MNRVDKGVGEGINWTTALVMIFIVLKVTGLTNMGWIWVFSPWWLSFALVAVIAVVFVIITVLLSGK